MELVNIISDAGQNKQLHNASVICLRGEQYPLLFCRHFISYLSRLHGADIISCAMNTEQHAETMASLQTTFLGNQSWYWLSSDDELPKSRDEVWWRYLWQYTGPNKLFFFTTKDVKRVPRSWCVVRVPTEADKTLFANIGEVIGFRHAAFTNYLYKDYRAIPLDTAVMLISYGSLLGTNWKTFADQWLHEFLVPETSLFALSQVFFAKKTKMFFAQWKQIAHSYGTPFWIAFWSEQLWQAYAYVRLQKAGRILEAKKVSYRLPFSFKNKDWQRYSLDELQSMHQLLYDIDFHMKNGGSEFSLELWYARFFAGKLFV